MNSHALAAAFAALCLATPVAAQDRPVERRAVAVADLDLSRPDHVDRLDRRIARAARELCADRTSSIDLSGRAAMRDCRSATRASAASARSAVIAANRPAATRTASR